MKTGVTKRKQHNRAKPPAVPGFDEGFWYFHMNSRRDRLFVYYQQTLDPVLVFSRETVNSGWRSEWEGTGLYFAEAREIAQWISRNHTKITLG